MFIRRGVGRAHHGGKEDVSHGDRIGVRRPKWDDDGNTGVGPLSERSDEGKKKSCLHPKTRLQTLNQHERIQNTDLRGGIIRK